MQGHRSFVSNFPDNLTLDHGSTSDTGVDSQMSWTNVQTSAQNRQSEFRISSNEAITQYPHHVAHDGLHSEWSSGETSSNAAQSQGDHSESKGDHMRSFNPQSAHTLEDRPFERPSILSLQNVGIHATGNQTENGSSLPWISGPDTSLPQDLNMRLEFEDSEDDECQVVEHSNTYISIGLPNWQILSTGNSSRTDENEDRPGGSLDVSRISCKRKALEVHADQTSVAGSSNCFQRDERSEWCTSAGQTVSRNIENEQVTNNGSEHSIPRLRLGGRAVSDSPLSLPTRGSTENFRRNFRLRINGSHQRDRIPGNSVSTAAAVINSDVSSSRRESRQAIQYQLPDLNPAPFVENENLQGGPVLHIPPVRRNTEARWVEASSSRTRGSSASSISGEDDMLYEEPALRNIPRSISEHPRYDPAREMGSSSQEPTNSNLAGGSNIIAGNVTSSQADSTFRENSSIPTWSHRSSPQYSRRLSEIVRRSLLSSARAESGGQNTNHATQASPLATTSQEMGLSSVPGNLVHTTSNSRASFMDRHPDAFQGPYTPRILAAASEGRSSIMSEQIRHVLDLMQREEGLRFEDVAVLDYSVFVDVADRHRDMRLDIDNMSYEELLVLGERIGNVCSGLKEETIAIHLKQRIYIAKGAEEDQAEIEPCSICREEYMDGEHIGTLECGHDFHTDCIKQWLMHKNLCAICKATGLNT